MTDITDLSDEKVTYLKSLIAQWKKREAEEVLLSPHGVKRTVDPNEFIVKPSHIIGGMLTRKMAYDDDGRSLLCQENSFT